MPVSLKTQAERTAKRQSQPVAPVLAVCAAFAAQPSVYPPETQNRTLRRCAGALRKMQTQKKNASGRLSAEERAASGEAAGYGFVKG